MIFLAGSFHTSDGYSFFLFFEEFSLSNCIHLCDLIFLYKPTKKKTSDGARKRGFLWRSSFWKEMTICALWSTLVYCSKFNGKLYFGIWKWVPNITFHQLLIHQDSPAFLPSLILLYLLVTMQGKGRSKGHVWLLLSLNLGLLILFYFDSLSRFFCFYWCLT